MQHTPTWPSGITRSRIATLNVLVPVRRPGRGAPERLRGVAGCWGVELETVLGEARRTPMRVRQPTVDLIHGAYAAGRNQRK